MKKRSIRIWAVIIISIQFLVVNFSLITSGRAFKNGVKVTGNSFNPYDPEQLASWRTENKHYGTHDWVAEAGLEAVKTDNSAQKWKDADGVDFWNERRTVIFLIGTEAPDVSPASLSMMLNGRLVKGYKTSSSHNIRFFASQVPHLNIRMKPQFTYIYKIIDDYEIKVLEAMKNGDCDRAAFFMGYIVHLITDLSSFHHTIVSSDVEPLWGTYSKPNSINPGSDIIWKNLAMAHHLAYEADIFKYTEYKDESTFTYPKNFEVSPGDNIKPLRDIALESAFHTRFDKTLTAEEIRSADENLNLEGAHNALWMFYASADENLEYISLADLRGMDKHYFKTQVQKQLDYAVKAVAQTLNYFGLKWNTETDLKCNGCTVSTEPPRPISLDRFLMIGISIFILLGLMSTILPIQILFQFKEVF